MLHCCRASSSLGSAGIVRLATACASPSSQRFRCRSTSCGPPGRRCRRLLLPTFVGSPLAKTGSCVTTLSCIAPCRCGSAIFAGTTRWAPRSRWPGWRPRHEFCETTFPFRFPSCLSDWQKMSSSSGDQLSYLTNCVGSYLGQTSCTCSYQTELPNGGKWAARWHKRRFELAPPGGEIEHPGASCSYERTHGAQRERVGCAGTTEPSGHALHRTCWDHGGAALGPKWRSWLRVLGVRASTL